jgi:DNA-binding NtrC family response regulator
MAKAGAGGGASMRVTLPVAAAAKGGMNKSLLMVDDNRTLSLAVRHYFEARQFDVITVSTLAEAHAAFLSRRPDVVIVDYLLPDGNALHLLAAFRAIDPSCPVIVLTGYSSVDLAARAIREGANQFLNKPVALAALAKAIERALADFSPGRARG